MRAYMIYHREEAAKNQGFVSMFAEAGRACGIDFSYVPYDEYREKTLPDFVLNRTRDAIVSRWYEERGIMVFHSSRITELGNHKGRTLDFLRGHLPKEILQREWAPATVFIPKGEVERWWTAVAAKSAVIFEEIREVFCSRVPVFPLSRRRPGSYVLKSVDGHGGNEVVGFCIPEDKSEMHISLEYWKYLDGELQKLSGKDCILQEMIPGDGRDVRVYILGNQIYQAVIRQGQQGDFRSNYSLGGRVEVYSLSDRERELVQAFLRVFHGEVLGMAGLDFIIAEDGSLIFNELEEMAGCRMLYQCTDRDIVRDYVLWLKKYMENKGCGEKGYGI